MSKSFQFSISFRVILIIMIDEKQSHRQRAYNLAGESLNEGKTHRVEAVTLEMTFGCAPLPMNCAPVLGSRIVNVEE